jgi:acetylornithine/succinyldiaminopimelate/putrescine aminotransferase
MSRQRTYLFWLLLKDVIRITPPLTISEEENEERNNARSNG